MVSAKSNGTMSNGYSGKGVGPDGIAPPKSSGIKVIIIGLGYAGVVAAVECFRKGHEVIVFEQAPQITNVGDVIGITANAAQIISKWGNGSVHEELQDILCDYEMLNLHTHTGEPLLSHTMLGYSAGSGYAANRGDMAVVFYKHALNIGIDIRLGQRITEYFETESEAGIFVNGKKISADCVLACDGVHSKARGFIIGNTGAPHATGYAVYRAWFNGKEARMNPKTKWITEGTRDKMEVYIGPNVHCIVGTGRRCQDVVWTCTHLDTYDIAESWSFPGKVEDALKVIEGWDERPRDIIAMTPEKQLIDYKLLWRDPLPGWVSKHGRMMLVGDSAHPFLPTSGQGAGQAIEDAATVAICLELAGKQAVPLALRTSEKIRYDRATLTQKLGVETRDAWHKTDWEEFNKNKKYLEMPRPDWIFGHDPQEYAYEEFEKAAEAVRTGGDYVPGNIPPPGVNHRTDDFDGKKVKASLAGLSKNGNIVVEKEMISSKLEGLSIST